MLRRLVCSSTTEVRGGSHVVGSWVPTAPKPQQRQFSLWSSLRAIIRPLPASLDSYRQQFSSDRRDRGNRASLPTPTMDPTEWYNRTLFASPYGRSTVPDDATVPSPLGPDASSRSSFLHSGRSSTADASEGMPESSTGSWSRIAPGSKPYSGFRPFKAPQDLSSRRGQKKCTLSVSSSAASPTLPSWLSAGNARVPTFVSTASTSSPSSGTIAVNSTCHLSTGGVKSPAAFAGLKPWIRTPSRPKLDSNGMMFNGDGNWPSSSSSSTSSSSNASTDSYSDTAVNSAPAEVRHLVVHRMKGQFEWIDISGVKNCPKDVYVELMAEEMRKFGLPEFLSELLHEQVVLPQCLFTAGVGCLIIRYALSNTDTCSNSMQDLTNRLSLVVSLVPVPDAPAATSSTSSAAADPHPSGASCILGEDAAAAAAPTDASVAPVAGGADSAVFSSSSWVGMHDEMEHHRVTSEPPPGVKLFGTRADSSSCTTVACLMAGLQCSAGSKAELQPVKGSLFGSEGLVGNQSVAPPPPPPLPPKASSSPRPAAPSTPPKMKPLIIEGRKYYVRLITLHREDCVAISEVRRSFLTKYATESIERVVNTIVSRCARTFMRELRMDLERFDSLECHLLDRTAPKTYLSEEIYHIKRRSSAFSHVLGMMAHSHKQFMQTQLAVGMSCPHVAMVGQSCMHVKLLSDEIDTNARSALDLLFQISNFELNGLIRVLTMFSAIFAPLGLVTGFYGMNLEPLPMQGETYAIPVVIATMVICASVLQVWFRYRAF